MAVRELARLDFRTRHRLGRRLDENPLRSYPGNHLPRAYRVARNRALLETGLYRVPENSQGEAPW